MRLSPLEPATYVWQSVTALAHFCAGRYSDAVLWAEAALRDQADFTFATTHLVGKSRDGWASIAGPDSYGKVAPSRPAASDE
jgi:hypothetical protein